MCVSKAQINSLHAAQGGGQGEYDGSFLSQAEIDEKARWRWEVDWKSGGGASLLSSSVEPTYRGFGDDSALL